MSENTMASACLTMLALDLEKEVNEHIHERWSYDNSTGAWETTNSASEEWVSDRRELIEKIRERAASYQITPVRAEEPLCEDEGCPHHGTVHVCRSVSSVRTDDGVRVERFEMQWPDYHAQGMGCGLEDRCITDRYEAMAYGWDQAIERVAEMLPDELCIAAADAVAGAGREAPASCPNCFDRSDCSSVDICNAVTSAERDAEARDAARWRMHLQLLNHSGRPKP